MLSPFLKRRATRPTKQQGYILLTLLLVVAIMAIMAATLVTSIKFDIQRDREEEMIHRGVQYSRAIKAYYKKFQRYPAKIEDLENTNQMRFLRKRYKDPITGKDFKLLHYGEAKLALNGVGGGMIPGASTVGANGQLNGPGGSPTSGFGGNGAFGNSNSGFGSNSFGQNSNSSFGQNSNSSFGQNNQNNQPAGSDSSQTAAGNGTDAQASQTVTANGMNSSNDQSSPNQQVQSFGGAPIVGVASTSKEKTIREFDKKKKYNEWQFVYDSTMDRGTLITTPYQPQLMMQGFGGTPNLNGQNGTAPNGNNGIGNNNSNGFGNSFGNSPGGMQNNPTPPSPGGYGNPSQPSQPPQQQ